VLHLCLTAHFLSRTLFMGSSGAKINLVGFSTRAPVIGQHGICERPSSFSGAFAG
jgi:hypothetical protein